MQIVLLDAAIADGDGAETWPGLDALGSVTRHDRTPPDAVAQRLAGADVAITNKAVVDTAVLEQCPTLRHVAVTATGVNVVDLDACQARGVAVTNVPAYSTESVAQHVFALILDDACAVAAHDTAVRDGAWNASDDFALLVRPTWELAGRRLAIIGHGAIGQAVERIGAALGMAVDVVQLPCRPEQAGRVALDEALSRADVVTLHCPLTPETQGLVDTAFLDRCREDVLLVNTGRGPLIDEAALAAWLKAHPAARAAVDVLSKEPPAADNPLLNHPQVRVTPHIAWATREARARLRGVVVDNIRAWTEGREQNRVA